MLPLCCCPRGGFNTDSCHQRTAADTGGRWIFPWELEEFQSGPRSRSNTAAATRIMSEEARTPPGCCVVFHQYIVGLLQHLATAYVCRCCCPLPGDYGTKASCAADITWKLLTPIRSPGNIVSEAATTICREHHVSWPSASKTSSQGFTGTQAFCREIKKALDYNRSLSVTSIVKITFVLIVSEI